MGLLGVQRDVGWERQRDRVLGRVRHALADAGQQAGMLAERAAPFLAQTAVSAAAFSASLATFQVCPATERLLHINATVSRLFAWPLQRGGGRVHPPPLAHSRCSPPSHFREWHTRAASPAPRPCWRPWRAFSACSQPPRWRAKPPRRSRAGAEMARAPALSGSPAPRRSPRSRSLCSRMGPCPQHSSPRPARPRRPAAARRGQSAGFEAPPARGAHGGPHAGRPPGHRVFPRNGRPLPQPAAQRPSIRGAPRCVARRPAQCPLASPPTGGSAAAGCFVRLRREPWPGNRCPRPAHPTHRICSAWS